MPAEERFPTHMHFPTYTHFPTHTWLSYTGSKLVTVYKYLRIPPSRSGSQLHSLPHDFSSSRLGSTVHTTPLHLSF
jgi:hypothetical protein